MLDQLLEDMSNMNTPKKGQGEKSGTRPPDSTRRSSMEKEVGEGVKALTGAGEKEAKKPAAVEEVARTVSLPPEQLPGLEVVQGKGKGGLLSRWDPLRGVAGECASSCQNV